MMRHMQLPLTKAPPEEDTLTLLALDFEPEFPCEVKIGHAGDCPNPAEWVLTALCDCGDQSTALYCEAHRVWVLRAIAFRQVQMVCHNGHPIMHKMKFIPIK